MVMRLIYRLSVGSVIFFLNCTDFQIKSDIFEIKIFENLSNTKNVKLSSIASSIEYYILETDKNFLVSSTSSIYCSEDYFVSIENHGCFVFERTTGNFVRQISSGGRGPSEFLSVISSFWDRDNENICVVGADRQLRFYNLDGTLSHQTSNFIDINYGYIVAFGDFYVQAIHNRTGNNKIKIAFYCQSGNLICSVPNQSTWEVSQPGFIGLLSDRWLYTFENNLFFKEASNDTLFQIENYELKPRLVFDTGGRAVPYELQEEGRWNLYAAFSSGREPDDRYERYILISKIIEDAHRLYFTIEHNQRLYPAVFEKMEKKLEVFFPVDIPAFRRDRKIPLYGFENDLDGGLPFWPQQIISDTEMMQIYSAEDLLELDASEITDENLKNLLQNLTEECNPVVAIVKLAN